MKRRYADRSRVYAFWGRVGRDVVTAFAVGLAAYAVISVQGNVEDTQDNVRDIQRVQAEARVETKVRIDQACRIFEQQQKDDVDRLNGTYRYLAGLKPHEFGQPINRAVLANLPSVIREAQTDDAPDYCDLPGVEAERKGAAPVGLPEPDPELPQRPSNIPRP